MNRIVILFALLTPLNFAADALPWPAPDQQQADKLSVEMHEQLAEGKFEYLNVGPWLIATDLPKTDAENFAASTISKFAAAIQRQLFATPRSEPVKVFLFKDKLSYENWNVKLFHEKPTTPFGYFSRARHAMVMNIGTGGGTLLHEMVHAMAEADYPQIPAWLNEGLGSLFEASYCRPDGKVVGVANWRLTGLKKALDGHAETKVKDLLTLSDGDFYRSERSGINYACARYLMQWLQQQGKLEAFYIRVREAKDKSAIDSLRAVFDNKLEVDEIESQCYKWAVSLRP